MRAVARLGQNKFSLYGRDPYEASGIDSFLDAALVFARDAQIYLLALISGQVSSEIHARAREGFAIYAGGINQALLPNREYIVGDSISLADICFVAEMSLFLNERVRSLDLEKLGLEPVLNKSIEAECPRVMAHFAKLSRHPAFAPDVQPYLARLDKLQSRHPQSSR